MSARKRQRRVIASDSDSEQDLRADAAPATAQRRLGRLRRAVDHAVVSEVELCDDSDDPTPAAAAAAARPPLPLSTPQVAAKPEAPATLRRSGLRQRVPNSRKAPRKAALEKLQRLRSGASGALEDSSDCGEGSEGGSLGSGSGGGGGGGSGEAQGEEASSEEEEQPSSSMEGFVVSDEDEERAGAALQQLRGMTGGKDMDEGGRMQLYTQLRLLRLLSALPQAADLSDEAKACIAVAMSFERNLTQFLRQMQNLEDWRRADRGLRARFDEYEALDTEPGGYRWGKHCSFCRHDRHRQIAMLLLCFRGRRQPVTLLEPILAERGLLPGSAHDASAERGTPIGGDGSGGNQSAGDCGSSSSEDDEPLSVGYQRRQALRMQQARQAERAQRARQRQQQGGTPLRARQVARQLAVAGGGSSDEDSLLGKAGVARHAQRHQQQGGQKRRYVSLLNSEEEQQEERQHQKRQQQRRQIVRQQQGEDAPASSSDEFSSSEESHQRQEGSAGQAREEEEEWSQGTDPDDSDSSASEMGERPRRRPRIGADCWARAYVHRSLHRFPARLDAMLLYCTRRYLGTTPEAEQPCSLAGLAHAVLQRYGRPLVRHYNQLMYSINGFNMLQNRKSDKSIANSMLVRELGELQYAHFTKLSPEEQLWGVRVDAELAAFAAAARKRRRRRVAAAVAEGADPAAAAEQVDAEEGCGRLLLLRAAVGAARAADGEEEEQEEGDVQYGSEEPQEEDEDPEQRRRTRRRHAQRQQQQQRERLEVPLFQREGRRAAAQRGGQRAAAAVAAAAAEFGELAGAAAAAGFNDLATPSTAQQRRQQQRQRQEGEQEGTPRDRNACFYCGATGHWAAACPERQRCFHCQEIGHWSRDCPKLQRGSCYKCRQPGHWAANCPNR